MPALIAARSAIARVVQVLTSAVNKSKVSGSSSCSQKCVLPVCVDLISEIRIVSLAVSLTH